jgi:hypothetical protein
MPIEVCVLDFVPAEVKELREGGSYEDEGDEKIFKEMTVHV